MLVFMIPYVVGIYVHDRFNALIKTVAYPDWIEIKQTEYNLGWMKSFSKSHVVLKKPFLKDFFANFGVEVSSESALAAGLVMGVMIIPFILSMSDDAINAVSISMKDAALAMGSTKSRRR